MLSVLIVEDDTQKFGRLHLTLTGAGVSSSSIKHAITGAQAYEFLSSTKFDLMLLDVNIPRRFGEVALRGGGLELLRQIGRDDVLIPPHHVVGITAYEDVIDEFGEDFNDRLWALIHYSHNSDHWIDQIGSKVRYIDAAKRSDNFNDGVTYGSDLAIICALDEPELSAVRRLPFGWVPLRYAQDDTRYLSGTMPGKASPHAVIAAAAPRMGIAASAVLATKIIQRFRPRLLAMTGICAGRQERAKIGDIIVADPSWDWASGKISSKRGQPKFSPSPHHLDSEPDAIAAIKELSEDAAELARLRQEFAGNKPDFELKVRVGPLASGAAVVADKTTLDGLLHQHRGLVGIDMEAYGVMSAARGSGKPRPSTIIVKSVCDYADKDKSDDYQNYAAYTSAGFLFRVAQRLLDPD